MTGARMSFDYYNILKFKNVSADDIERVLMFIMKNNGSLPVAVSSGTTHEEGVVIRNIESPTSFLPDFKRVRKEFPKLKIALDGLYKSKAQGGYSIGFEDPVP